MGGSSDGAWLLEGDAMSRYLSIGLCLAILATGQAVAETGPDCIKKNKEERWAIRGDFDRESGLCKTDQCQKEASAKYRARGETLKAHQAACDAFLRSQQAAPQSPTSWKPGDPAPVAPDGRRYIMSCSGKVLGLYKPGGAMEVELQSHPGNCIPLENWGPGPGPVHGKSSSGRCWDAGSGIYRDYSGSLPSGCDPNR